MKKILGLFILAMGLISCVNQKEQDKIKNPKIKNTNISIEKVQESLKNNNNIIIDTRSYDEYNGWDIEKNGVNGHIVGAISFPTSSIKDGDLKKTLERKEIDKDKEIILYGKDSQTMLDTLVKIGYKVSIFNGGVKEWKNNNLPIKKMKNYKIIVPVSWIKNLLDGKNIDFYDGRKVKIFNVGWDETGKKHIKEHIPRSYWFHTGWLEEGPLWNKVSDIKIKKELEKQGITKNTLLLLYGDPMAAARVGAIAEYAGVEDVRMINGGLKAWKDAGYKVETGISNSESVSEFGAVVPQNPNIIIDLPEAIQLLKDKDGDLISIRSWKEYLGKVSGYDYIKPRGRIKGAKWGMAGSDPWHLEDYRATDQFHMRPYTEIQKMWNKLGINTNNHLAFYCGTGWRGSEVWFYAKAMGLKKISIYDGGWKEWSESSETKDKFLKGEPKKLNRESFLD